MRLSSIQAVLGALLAINSSLLLLATAQSLTDQNILFSDSGPRYWAWAKLAYDGDYNNQQGRTLGNGQGKPWATLSGDNIYVKGYSGAAIAAGSTPWDTFTGMKAIVGQDSTRNVIVLAFIGSNDFPTFKQDVKFFGATDGSIKGAVEKGFYECFQAVSGTVLGWAVEYANANPNWNIVITGHSLGGATAQIAAAVFVAQNPDLAQRVTVFTYGAPRAGDLTFHQSLATAQGTRMANFQHEHDLVPDLPPIAFGYANAGGRWVFSPTGSQPSWSNQALWTSKSQPDQTKAGFTAIVDTARSVYSKFNTHTGYFTDSSNTKRGIMFDDNVQINATSLKKRDAPTTTDFIDAANLISNMEATGEITEANLQSFANSMKIPDDESTELQVTITDVDAMDRTMFLRMVMTVAMGQ